MSSTLTSNDSSSTTLEPVVTLTGADGAAPGSEPFAGLIMDGHGDLFGTAAGFGGEVFEIVNNGSPAAPDYAATTTVLASFASGDTTLGYQPEGQLAADDAGDLFGANLFGGANGDGALFEIPVTDSGYGPAQLVATFSGANGAWPTGSIVVDPSGNLYGMTMQGGEGYDPSSSNYGYGVIFEVAKDAASSTGTGYDAPVAVVSFTGNDGAAPGALPSALIQDGSGGLIGATAYGGLYGEGEIFTVSGAGAFSVVASFGDAAGDTTGPGLNPYGLVQDPYGDLFGTTANGGQFGYGTIYEIPMTPDGYGSLVTLASFNGTDGVAPQASLIVDSSGNLFGTTTNGGDTFDAANFQNGYGVVFELAADGSTPSGYSDTPTVLGSFNVSASNDFPNGANPYSSLVADSAGNVLGTTAYGGDSASNGVVFEVTNSGFQTVPCFCAGTKIATATGEIAVEALRIGDLVRTAQGGFSPVRWIGRKAVSRLFGDPLRVLPVRIKAGALGENVPRRDLLLSPDHALFVDGLLVHAAALVNGVSIQREMRMTELFVYYHVELADHALILAEGAPAETFIDNVERMSFDNWAEFEALHPEGAGVPEMLYPRVKSWRQTPPDLRARLAERARALAPQSAAA
jgi:hypothetical protein